MNHSEILGEIRNSRLLVVGDVMLDRYWWGSVNRISPEAPVPVVLHERTSLAAGGGANVALNLAGLGASVHLIGVTGDDQEADELASIFDEHNIGNRLSRSSDRRTIVKTRIVAHGQHVVRIDQESIDPLAPDEAEQLNTAIAGILTKVDAVIFSDYGKGLFTDTFLTSSISTIRAAGKPIFVDPKGSKFDKYRGVTAITPNRREALTACSIDEHLPNGTQVAGDDLMGLLDAVVLITEGEHGMTLFEPGQSAHHLDSFAHDVFDVTGAGDTVIAAFAAAIAAGRSMKEAAWLANVSAGLVVGKQGTTAITTKMIHEFLATGSAASTA